MSFPTVAATNTSIVGGGSTSHSVSLPSSISSGDLLIVGFVDSIGTSCTTTFPTGWTAVGSKVDNGGNTGVRLGYRVADGTEGASITVVTSAATKSAHCSYRITGFDSGTAPEQGSGTTGSDATAELASYSPSWGSADTLWLEFGGDGDVGGPFTAGSTNYTDLLAINTTGTQSASNCCIGSARRNNTTATESPDAMTITASFAWVSVLAAVRPTGGAATAVLGDNVMWGSHWI